MDPFELRDKFALAAMREIMANPFDHNVKERVGDSEEVVVCHLCVAYRSYEIANKMMSARHMDRNDMEDCVKDSRNFLWVNMKIEAVDPPICRTEVSGNGKAN